LPGSAVRLGKEGPREGEKAAMNGGTKKVYSVSESSKGALLKWEEKRVLERKEGRRGNKSWRLLDGGGPISTTTKGNGGGTLRKKETWSARKSQKRKVGGLFRSMGGKRQKGPIKKQKTNDPSTNAKTEKRVKGDKAILRGEKEKETQAKKEGGGGDVKIKRPVRHPTGKFRKKKKVPGRERDMARKGGKKKAWGWSGDKNFVMKTNGGGGSAADRTRNCPL